MCAPNTANWVRLGLLALPVYGLLTCWGTLTNRLDPNADFDAYARYISSTSYLVNHLVVSILGRVPAIFGANALGVYFAGGRAGRTALFPMVTSIAGNALILTIFGWSTFVSPAIGRAYLAGQQNIVEVNQDTLGTPLFATSLSGGLLYSVVTILFGVAVWRSGTLPRGAGVLSAPAGLLISILGLQVGASQTPGTVLLIAGSGWIACRCPTEGAIVDLGCIG